MSNRMVVLAGPCHNLPRFKQTVPFTRKLLLLLESFNPSYHAFNVQPGSAPGGYIAGIETIMPHYIFNPGWFANYMSNTDLNYLTGMMSLVPPNICVKKVRGRLSVLGIAAPFVTNDATNQTVTNSSVTMMARVGKGVEKHMIGYLREVTVDRGLVTNIVTANPIPLSTTWGVATPVRDSLSVGTGGAAIIGQAIPDGVCGFKKYPYVWCPSIRSNGPTTAATKFNDIQNMPITARHMIDVDLTECEGPIIGWEEDIEHYICTQPTVYGFAPHQTMITPGGFAPIYSPGQPQQQDNVTVSSDLSFGSIADGFVYDQNNLTDIMANVTLSRSNTANPNSDSPFLPRPLEMHHLQLIAPPTSIVGQTQPVLVEAILETQCWVEIDWDNSCPAAAIPGVGIVNLASDPLAMHHPLSYAPNGTVPTLEQTSITNSLIPNPYGGFFMPSYNNTTRIARQ